MSKIYQPKCDNWIEHNVYMQIIFIIRDYDRMIEEYRDLLEESPNPPDGQPRGSGTGDPTARKVFKAVNISDKIKAIDKAIEYTPKEYCDPILENIKTGKPFPDYANRKTWTKWKGRFIRIVGENLYLI